MRLRAAWGRSGQQPDAFAALRTYEPAVGPAGTPTVRPENIGNPDLEPEVGDEIEVGFDAALFAERIGLEVTLYRQVRNDALVQVPVRPSTGFPGVRFENLGRVRNRGLEAFLHGEVWRAGSFGLDLGLQVALNQNRLASLGGEGPRQLRLGQYLVEGFPIGSIFAKRVVSSELEGVGATARAVNTLCEGGTPIPGSESLAAFGLSRGGGSPVPCAEAPLVYWGEPIPTRNLTGTVRLSLPGSLVLSAQVDYQGGFHMANGTVWQAHRLFRVSEQSQRLDDPIFVAYQGMNPVESAGGLGTIDSSFAKLRRVSAAWTAPATVARRVGADQLSVTAVAHDLWTPWQATRDVFGYPVLDAEARITGGAGEPGGLSAYYQDAWPQMKRFSVTARVVF